jgi:hypothetical protein
VSRDPNSDGGASACGRSALARNMADFLINVAPTGLSGFGCIALTRGKVAVVMSKGERELILVVHAIRISELVRPHVAFYDAKQWQPAAAWHGDDEVFARGVCGLMGLSWTQLSGESAASTESDAHASEPAPWRVGLARLLINSTVAGKDILVFRQGRDTLATLAAVLKCRPLVQPAVLLCSDDAAALEFADSMYVVTTASSKSWLVTPFTLPWIPVRVKAPPGYVSSTLCPCGEPLIIARESVYHCSRCDCGWVAGARCSACSYALCLRCVDALRFTETRIHEGAADDSVNAMTVPCAVQVLVPDVVGVVMQFCQSIAEAHRVASVCRSWRKGFFADGDLWARFFRERWPARGPRVRKAGASVYRTRVLAELRTVGLCSEAERRSAHGSYAAAYNATTLPLSLCSIENCDETSCPMMSKAMRMFAGSRFCELCRERVQECESEDSFTRHRVAGDRTSFSPLRTPHFRRHGAVPSKFAWFLVLGSSTDAGASAFAHVRRIATALPWLLSAEYDALNTEWINASLHLVGTKPNITTVYVEVVLDDPSNRPEYGQDGIHVLAAPSPLTGHDLAMAHAQQIVAFVATRIRNPTFADNVRAAAPFRVTVPRAQSL